MTNEELAYRIEGYFISLERKYYIPARMQLSAWSGKTAKNILPLTLDKEEAERKLREMERNKALLLRQVNDFKNRHGL